MGAPAAQAAAASPASATLPLVDRKPVIAGLTEVVVKPSVLSDAISISGDIRTKGALHIDGYAKGTIDAGSVTIGGGGLFEGTIRCGRLHVKGIFSGNGACEDLVVSEEAQVAVGSLSYKTIAIQRGARVAGDLVLIES
jgi:cytoskeletal protein CcmA (bactofilin family)